MNSGAYLFVLSSADQCHRRPSQKDTFLDSRPKYVNIKAANASHYFSVHRSQHGNLDISPSVANYNQPVFRGLIELNPAVLGGWQVQ